MKSNEIQKIISEEVNRVLEQEQGLVELSRLNEAKLRKGDIIKMQDGEYGVVNKLKGKVAYIKLKSSPGTFHPIEADRTTYKGKHKGKDLYLESLNEARDFVVIDPRGNAKPVGMKIQGAQYVKKMGGPRKGYHLVLSKNAKKARRAVEKHGATSSKTQNLMFDLMYEGPQVAPQKRMEFGVEYVDGKGKPKKDNSLIKRFKTKALADKYAKKGNKIDKVGGKYTVVQVPVQEISEVDYQSKLSRGHKPDHYQLGTSDFKSFNEAKLTEAVSPKEGARRLVDKLVQTKLLDKKNEKKAIDLLTYLMARGVHEGKLTEATKLARGLKPLLMIGTKITKKIGEEALLKLSDKFDRIDDEYAGDIASHLDMAIELMQDGYPGDATKMLKQFNKKCKEVLKGKPIASVFEGKLTEGKLNEMDINDPILVAIRARKIDLKKKAALPKVKKISTKQYYKLMDAEIDLIDQMKDAAKDYERLDSEMNQEAGQKGDAWTDADANRYGGDLNKLQTKVEKLAKQKLAVKKQIMNYRVN